MELVCSNCLSVNRIPDEKLHDKPICGKCKQSLLPAQPIELTDQSFAKFISRTSLPVLVDFWAPWCGPCRMMAPAFAEAAAQLSPQVILAKLNTEAHPQSASPFNITGIPTVILFQSGTEAKRQSGMMNASQIAQFVS